MKSYTDVSYGLYLLTGLELIALAELVATKPRRFVAELLVTSAYEAFDRDDELRKMAAEYDTKTYPN